MKVEVKKSIEGGKFKKVIIDKELFDALFEYDKANEVFTYLIFNKICDIKSETIENICKKIDLCRDVFKSYGLDKYDVRAKYLFEESKIID